MINASETYVPDLELGIKNDERQVISGINATETYIDPSNMVMYASDHKSVSEIPVLSRGYSIGAGYVVGDRFEVQGKQSNVYMVRREGKLYVAKLYRPQCQPVQRVRDFLRSRSYEYLADIIESGKLQGYCYEIYDYYAQGTLEDMNRITISYIQKVVIPSINEGLHSLHSNGIIHCDIKPSNIFVANEERVCIGDFGSCAAMGDDGTATIAIQGTPEYSAPVTSFYGQATITPAYDYCSFGLVIYRLVTGRSLLGNATTEEIARLWQKGFQLTSDISPRMAEIIKGLIEIEPEKRWGYKEVKRWIDKEFISSKKTTLRKRKETETIVKPLIFGKINGEFVSAKSVSRLVSLMKENWTQAKVVVRRIETEHFLRQFNPEYTAFLREVKKQNDDDAIVFKLIYHLEMDEKIIFRGRNFGTLQDMLDTVRETGDTDVVDLILSGLFVYYLKLMNVDSRSVDQIDRIIKQAIGRKMDFSAIETICYAFLSDKMLDIDGIKLHTLEEFVDYLVGISLDRIHEVIGRSEVVAWLYTMGLGSNAMRMAEIKE